MPSAAPSAAPTSWRSTSGRRGSGWPPSTPAPPAPRGPSRSSGSTPATCTSSSPHPIILWLQQFGRGLRKAYGKARLTVIDYIGNHRVFLTRPRALFGLGSGDAEIARQLNLLEQGQAELPPDCEVTYELEAREILRAMLRGLSGPEALETFYRDFKERHGEPPTPLEAFEEGYNPRRTGSANWFRFVKAMGDLPADRARALEVAGEFLDELQTTQMTRSYKMLTLLAMLDADAFPGEIDAGALAAGFADRASRAPALRADVSDRLQNPEKLRKLLEENPIAAWVGGKGTGGRAFFAYDGERFRATFRAPADVRPAFQEMVRETVDWRLAEYLSRTDVSAGEADRIVCKVLHAGGRPILFLPPREQHPGIPSGWTDIVADGKPYRANFVKVAVNVVQEPGSEENRLLELLRAWFGPDAGKPGTAHQVAFTRAEDRAPYVTRSAIQKSHSAASSGGPLHRLHDLFGRPSSFSERNG